jgi:hypothetical protein
MSPTCSAATSAGWPRSPARWVGCADRRHAGSDPRPDGLFDAHCNPGRPCVGDGHCVFRCNACVRNRCGLCGGDGRRNHNARHLDPNLAAEFRVGDHGGASAEPVGHDHARRTCDGSVGLRRRIRVPGPSSLCCWVVLLCGLAWLRAKANLPRMAPAFEGSETLA